MSTFRRRTRALAYVMSLVLLAAVTWFPTHVLAQLSPQGSSFNGGTISLPIIGGLGTASAPVYAMTSNDGMYSRTAGTVDITGGGVGFVEFQNNSAVGIELNSTLALCWSSAAINVACDTTLRRKSAAIIEMGTDANGAVVAQRLQGANGITGTDIAGGNIAFGGQVGTGAGAGAQSGIDRALMRATGTTAQVNAPAIYACESKTLSNTTATTTALATVALASNSAGSVRITASVTCDDGTNFDSDVITSYVAYVNKATVITFGTPVTTASAAANNSGSCTVAPTFTAGSSLINVNVTPVITTIVPTTTTAYLNIETFGAGAVSCK